MKPKIMPFLFLIFLTLGLFLGLLAGEKSNPAPTPWRGQGAPTATPHPQLLMVTGTAWWQGDLPTPVSLHTSTPTMTPTSQP
ncbi:hypothetical protein ATHL_01008 [Anaerolinea thermolimosa]|uniref:hypothetical protein n=1 Tax=Anaerolinea thermolimosa TaxID=229919 RepID=UPI0007845AE8|nr:hypothetical protein [Anaerolinea thermolimosa]GAP06162.1 hypothetical protein ATHL_01008 [Anaerolinea thermolimosa]